MSLNPTHQQVVKPPTPSSYAPPAAFELGSAAALAKNQSHGDAQEQNPSKEYQT
jgi:hypothetical protein